MGKTTFCLNYLAHARKRFPKIDIALVSLASRSVDQHLKAIPNKSGTVLIADAFDEDYHGWSRARDRLSEILEIAEDFKTVIITCRSQYFLSDDAIPRETPLAMLVPRGLGQTQTFSLIRSYISPFSPEEITRYIDRHFPRLYFWRWRARRRATDLVGSIPDLAYRPMLLERLPDLAKQNTKSHEIFDLYELLIDGWLQRESRWIAVDRLNAVSLELAVEMFTRFSINRGKMSPEEIERFAEVIIGESPDWSHLTSRSLLNRDSAGRFKFAHKSILEFLVVKAGTEGNDRAFETYWTDFMKELFISWGHSDVGRSKWSRAQVMLKSDDGRQNIAPFYDPLDTRPVMGLPDFQRCAERRRTSTGQRIAPTPWRSSSIDLLNDRGRGIITILDAEYNFSWSYFPTIKDHWDFPRPRIVDCLKYVEINDAFKLPSYEQFITLVEGLHRISRDVLPDGPLFLLGDRPGRHEHLLAQLNSDIIIKECLNPIDKQRRIKGTNSYITCYETGIKFSASYATELFVEQLYLDDIQSSLKFV